MTLRRRQRGPLVGLDGVGLDPDPLLIAAAEMVLRLRVSLLGGGAEPARGLDMVDRKAAAVAVHLAEVVLCPVEALLRGQQEELRRLGLVLLQTQAVLVHFAKRVLRARQTADGGLLEPVSRHL